MVRPRVERGASLVHVARRSPGNRDERARENHKPEVNWVLGAAAQRGNQSDERVNRDEGQGHQRGTVRSLLNIRASFFPRSLFRTQAVRHREFHQDSQETLLRVFL